MTVLCRFKCNEVVHFQGHRKVKLSAIEKADFAKWTPSGTFEFSLTNESVYAFFEPGKVYDIRIDEHSDDANLPTIDPKNGADSVIGTQ